MDIQDVNVVGAKLLEGTIDGGAEGFFVVAGVVDEDVTIRVDCGRVFGGKDNLDGK